MRALHGSIEELELGARKVDRFIEEFCQEGCGLCGGQVVREEGAGGVCGYRVGGVEVEGLTFLGWWFGFELGSGFGFISGG